MEDRILKVKDKLLRIIADLNKAKKEGSLKALKKCERDALKTHHELKKLMAEAGLVKEKLN